MKVKCIKNSYTTGCIFKGIETCDLTVGKVYEVMAIPVVSDWGGGTNIDIDEIVFLLFNDKGKWVGYPKNLFIPVEHE